MQGAAELSDQLQRAVQQAGHIAAEACGVLLHRWRQRIVVVVGREPATEIDERDGLPIKERVYFSTEVVGDSCRSSQQVDAASLAPDVDV